jgi:shikimate kinase
MGLFTFVVMQSNLIFLIGFMGVGKTTIGKRLANKLNIPFIDLDQEIEKKFQISINEFFAKYGEQAFRTEETKMLKFIISESEQAIISVGGGLPCYNENIQRMNVAGKTLYLQRPAKELYNRLVNSKADRPLLNDLKGDELLRFIEDKLLVREGFYNQAQIKLTRDQQEISEIVELLKSS